MSVHLAPPGPWFATSDGRPRGPGARAPASLALAYELLLTDLVAAEAVYVLETFDEAPRNEVATALRSLVVFESLVRVDRAQTLRAVEA